MNILGYYRNSIVDGEGIRFSIYLSGCSHKCNGCHNPESWNPNNGEELTERKLTEIVNLINFDPMVDGITISGGDPFYNPKELLDLLMKLKSKTKKDIWVYTGYLLEEILEDESMKKCLLYIDTLVDGPFIKELYDPKLEFRGSSNQRIINIHNIL